MGPTASFASVVRIDPEGRSFLFVPCKAGECVRYVPPRAVSFVPSAGRSSRFTTCCCLRAWGLYPLPRVSSVSTPRDDLPAAVPARGACTPFRVSCLYRPRGMFVRYRHSLPIVREGPVPLPAGIVCCYLAVRQVPPSSDWEGAVPPSAMPYVPTPRDARSGLSVGAACAREACTPSSGRRRHLPLPRVLSSSASRVSFPGYPPAVVGGRGPVPLPSGIVCTDPVGRAFRRRVSVPGLYLVPA